MRSWSAVRSTLEMTQEVLADLLRASERRITIDEIQKKVAEHYNVRLADMHSARRCARGRPPASGCDVSGETAYAAVPAGNRPQIRRPRSHHGHSCRAKIEELSAYDAAFREDVELLRRLLQTRTALHLVRPGCKCAFPVR